MFDLGLSEILLIAVVAIVVIGPKDLPRALAMAGKWVGKARAMSRNMRAGFDAMVREAEMQELEKQWAEQNARIMAEHGPVSAETGEPQTAIGSSPLPPTPLPLTPIPPGPAMTPLTDQPAAPAQAALPLPDAAGRP